MTWIFEFLCTKVIQPPFIEHLLCPRLGSKSSTCANLHANFRSWYHHYSHVTDEETEVYKSSATCPESYSRWEVKSGFEFANITGCRYCCSYVQEKLLQSKPVSNLYLKLLAFDLHATIICHHSHNFTVRQLFIWAIRSY